MKIICSGLLFLTLNCIWGQTDIQYHIDQLFNGYTNETPGVSITVVKDDSILFSKGYGRANLEYGIPVTPRTPFHVASVSKQFTAYLIYILKEEGRLNLNDPVRKFIPELPAYTEGIKIRHLLAHTSGLRDQWALLTLGGWKMEDVIETRQLLDLINLQNQLNFEPGTAFKYSNTGYTLLAIVAERASGSSFTALIHEKIFEPLEMVNSGFYDDFHKLIENRAYSYEKSGESYLKKKLNYSTVGATSLFTTSEDLAKWAAIFMAPKIGSKKLNVEFDAVSKLDNGQPVIWSALPNDTTYHAKGQLVYKYKSVQVISHGGHDAGFRATLTRFPEHNLAIAALSNDEHYNMFANFMAIAGFILEDAFKDEAVVPENRVSSPTPLVESKDLSVYTGTYWSDEVQTQYEVRLREGGLSLYHLRLGEIPLEPVGEHRFSGQITFPVTITFTTTASGVTGFEISNFGVNQLRFSKKL